MRIMLVTEYYPPHVGGVEVVFSTLARELVKRGHECHVVTCRVPNSKKYEECEGAKIHRINVPRRNDRYWFALLATPTALKIARHVDLIHTTTFTGAIPAWVVSKLLRKKCVITVHEVWSGLWSDLAEMNCVSARFHRFLERAIISLNFDKYVCVSRYTRNCLRLLGIKDKKLQVIYNGIDYEFFNPSKADGTAVRAKFGTENNFVYMYYGRAGISKGLEYLIQAVPLISKDIPNSRLLLILGDEPKDRRKHIIEMISSLRIEKQIILLRPVPKNELPSYIAASDCVVVPSLSEGFGFTAAEACAMERPIVSTDVASLPEVVSGKNVLVSPRSPDEIARAVSKVYHGDVETSLKKIFTWDECVERYLKVYQGDGLWGVT